MIYPIDAVVAVTYRCQSRCRMCSIWSLKGDGEIAPSVYEKLPTTLRDINISGGEPFLRHDLADIVRVVHRRLPRCRMVVSTNGLMGEALVPKALELKRIFPAIGFAVSLDGIGEMQDFIRGTAGGYEKVLAAIDGMKANGIENIRIAFTLTTENWEHMMPVFRLAEKLGVQFTMAVSHDSDFFFGTNESSILKRERPAFHAEKIRAGIEEMINGELATWNVKSWGRAFLNFGIYKIISDGKALFPSRPGMDYFYLDPKGDVYPSVVHGYVMGNIAESDFDSIWQSSKSEEIRAKCAADKTQYWMGCMLRKALLDHRWQIGMWCLKHKFLKLHLQSNAA